MSNIEFIDGTVKIGELGRITGRDYRMIKECLSRDQIEQAIDIVVFCCGYSPNVAKRIVYELI